ncbi:MAG: recombinase RecT [Alphaproteobacteria bacterium]|nr:recombinase RecT [Alphaproteobacteria bacterium]
MTLPVPISTAVSKRESLLPGSSQLGTQLELAKLLFESGTLPTHIKSPAAAFAIVQKGLEVGLPPMYALSNIVFINGRPSANAEAMQALIYRDHGDDALRFEETTDDVATVSYKRRGWTERRTASFTLAEAERAGLTKKDGPWRQYPAAMLRARAISVAARMAFADTIGGLYTPEELGADVTIDGEDQIVVREVPPETTIARPTPVPKALARPEPAPSPEEDDFDPAAVGPKAWAAIEARHADDPQKWGAVIERADASALRDRLERAVSDDDAAILVSYFANNSLRKIDALTRAEAGAISGFLKSHKDQADDRLRSLRPVAQAWLLAKLDGELF